MNKSIVFIHPLGVNWTPGQKDMARIANIMPPIGLCSLTAWLEKHGYRCYIHDYFAKPGSDDELIRLINENKPRLAGISATTSSFFDGIRITKLIKKHSPDTKVVFGGPHISAVLKPVLQDFPDIDFAIVSEGEESMLALLECDGQQPSEIPGLIYRDGDEVLFTGHRALTLQLDDLPFPAYDKLAGYPEKYMLPIFNYPTTPNTSAVTSRGCPFRCSYCDRSVFGPTYRCNSAEYLFELTRWLHTKYGIRHINFYDDLFTMKKDRVFDYCDKLLKSNLKMTFNCAARAEHLDDDMLKALKEAGCWMISLGIESGDEQLLKNHRLHADLEMIQNRVEMIVSNGIRVKGLFMVGLPGETEDSIDRTIKFALDLPLSDLNVAKFTPFPGTPVYQNIREYGVFDENWDLMNCLNFVFVPNGFTKDRLDERYMEFYRTYYKRVGVLMGYVAMIWRSPNSWMRFFKNLGDFMSIRKAYR